MAPTHTVLLTIDGTEYVALPRAEYLRHFGGAAAESEALSLEQFDDLVRAKVGRDLKAARVHAGLTQAQLAKKLRRAQTTVSKSEAGKIQVSEAYIRQVLKVCGLNEDFSAS